MPEINGQISETLNHVMDPEVGLPITRLGFVENFYYEDGEVTVVLRFCSAFCPAFFAVNMSETIRTELAKLKEVQKVTIKLSDHFMSEKIESYVNR